MPSLALNVDTIIAAILVLVALYGVVGGPTRLRSVILSTYVGIVISQTLGSTVAPYIKQLGSDQVSLALFIVPIIVFALPKHHSAQTKGSGIVNILVGLIAGAFVVAAGLHVLPPSSSTKFAQDSFLATQLIPLYLWFIVLMPLAALLPHFLKLKSRHAQH